MSDIASFQTNWTTTETLSNIGIYLIQKWVYPLGLISVFTNLLVFISSGLILKSNLQPRSTYMFLGNLALADLLHGTIFLSILTFYPSIKQGSTCVAVIGLTGSYVIECALSVCLIAIDRYVYINHGLYYTRWMTTNRTRCILLASWTLSLIVGSVPMLLFADSTDNGKDCSFFEVTPLYLMILISSAGLFPDLATIVLYILIFRTAYRTRKAMNVGSRKVGRLSNGEDFSNTEPSDSPGGYDVSYLRKVKDNRKIENQEESNENGSFRVNINNSLTNLNNIEGDAAKEKHEYFKIEDLTVNSANNDKDNEVKNKQQNTTKTKSTMIVFLAMCSCTLTWGPCFVCLMMFPIFCGIDVKTEFCSTLENVLLFVVINVGLINAMLNPIIYCWWHKGFRNSLTRVCFKKAAREKLRKDYVLALRST